MPRSLSKLLKDAAFASSTSEVPLVILKIDTDEQIGGSPVLAAPIRVVDDLVALSRTDPVDGAVTYLPFPFSVMLPLEEAEELGTVKIKIDNIERQIITQLRAIKEPLKVTVGIVARSDPDNAVEFGVYQWRNNTYDVNVIDAICEIDNMVDIAYPGDLFNPADWTGLG